MSDKEWAAFQRDMSRQNLERYESEKEVDDARKRVQHIERIIDREAPFRAQFLTKLVEKGQVKPDRNLGTPSDESWLSKT